MANLYAQSTKITNASGRWNYLTDPLRQEEIVIHKVFMTYDWQFYSEYKKTFLNKVIPIMKLEKSLLHYQTS